MTSYNPESTLSSTATVSRVRLLSGDVYVETGRGLMADDEILSFIFDLDHAWRGLAQKAVGFYNPRDLPAQATETDDRVAGTSDDYLAWTELCRRAASEVCLMLSMRNPEWSVARHRAYRTRAKELTPVTIPLKRV